MQKEGTYVKLAIRFHNSNANYFQLCSLQETEMKLLERFRTCWVQRGCSGVRPGCGRAAAPRLREVRGCPPRRWGQSKLGTALLGAAGPWAAHCCFTYILGNEAKLKFLLFSISKWLPCPFSHAEQNSSYLTKVFSVACLLKVPVVLEHFLGNIS